MRVPTTILAAAAPELRSRVQAAAAAHQPFALPTDTVYGLSCPFDDRVAIEALYRVKGRSKDKAIPVLLGTKAQLALVVPPWPSALVKRLADHFWPGPLTIVMEARPGLPSALLGGGDTVAVRVVDHPVFQAVAAFTGPLATTSANLSGRPDCSDAQAVEAQLEGRIPLIVDGGRSPQSRPSTIVQAHGERLRILRAGSLSEAVQNLQRA